ncbi:MAG TPA: NADPH:quinone reductase [Verrucomicrobiales bacterium]|nr:NADPH:quinone reductase [Verrucomicrobiales bacterium]
MQAAFIRRPGPPEAIEFGRLPNPEPSQGQILVRVDAVSVNPIDTYLRSGAIPMELPFPYVVGCDLAGAVVERGPGASRFQPGDRVWGSNQGLLGRQGTFAEFACVDEEWLYPLPDGVSPEAAAATALVGITAHLGLVQRAQLQPGETLFVSGGSGGVGSMVIQMARLLGARVLASAGSPANIQACLDLGAEQAFDYRSATIAEEIAQAAPEGVAVWWETSRSPDLETAVAGLAPGGRIVLMAGREARPPFPVGTFYVKGASLLGFVMFQAPAEDQRRCAGDINLWLAEGSLRPRIGRVLPLSETAEAHRLQEDNTLRQAGTLSGKIVLTP